MRILKLSFLMLFFSNSFVFSKPLINCFELTEKYGKKYSIPDKLLTSISLVESGIKKQNKFVSWPWTLNVGGEAHFFESKNEALEFLKKNYKKKKNIDVGCMQISMKYHAHNFKSFDEIIDPENNVKYAAKFLKKLFSKHKRWNEAISRYHSSEPQKKKKYLNRVNNYWSEIRQRKINIQPTYLDKKREKIEFFRRQLSDQYKNIES